MKHFKSSSNSFTELCNGIEEFSFTLKRRAKVKKEKQIKLLTFFESFSREHFRFIFTRNLLFDE